MVHSAPQTALNLDVTLSCVLFYPKHILFVMLTAFVYLGYYIFLYFMMGPNAPPIYAPRLLTASADAPAEISRKAISTPAVAFIDNSS